MKWIALPFLLSACVAQQPANSFRVVWVDDAHKVCERVDGQRTVIGTIKGCAKRDGDVCVIYAKRPSSSSDNDKFVTLGHELMHCVEGNWHNQWGEMRK